MTQPDVVVPVRPGKHDEPDSLRYALRTIWHHLDVGKIWIVGHHPSWLDSSVGHIPSAQRTQMYRNVNEPHLKFQNQEANLRAVMASEVSEDFLWWSDDFFVLRDTSTDIPYFHRGSLRDYLDTLPAKHGWGEYAEGLGFCLKLLEAWGYPHPDAYNVHMPLPVNKTNLIEVMEMAWAEGLQGGWLRPIYPVVCGDDHPHVEVTDPKIKNPNELPDLNQIWVSCDPGSWRGALGQYIRNRYWRTAPWEV